MDRFGGNRQRGPNSAESMGSVDDGEQTAPIDMRQSKLGAGPAVDDEEEEEDDEVQIVAERLASPKEQSPLRFGTMSYGPLGRRQKQFVVSTRQKQAKERQSRKPDSILSQVRRSNISAVRKPPAINSFWLQHTSSNPSYLRQKFPIQRVIARPRTPRRTGYLHAFNREDHLKYSAILFGGNPDAFPKPPASSTKKKSLFFKEALSPFGVSEKKVTKEIKRPELITLDDDDDEDDDSEEITILSRRPPRPSTSKAAETRPTKPAVVVGDADVIEIVNAYSSPPPPQASAKAKAARKSEYLEELRLEREVQDDFLDQLRKKYDHRDQESLRHIREKEVVAKHVEDRRHLLEKTFEERLRKHLKITEVAIPEPEPEEEEQGLPEITREMEEQIEEALTATGTVVDAHKIPITRNDLDTLRGLNWLNDEVINFYMQMIVERGGKNDNWPNVYATNTFFYPKLMQSGHAALKRWTRKVDVFSFDLIIVPVHLGMHWCLATVDFKRKGVYYYDSMGGNNGACLTALLKYLEDEHLDKKKQPFNASGFKAEIVKDIPQQMNGSDCGMFTCKFAEYLSRNAEITFSQEDMPYFRRRMTWEIARNTLLHP